MIQARKTNQLPKMDLVTVLIILIFLVLTFGVYFYYKHRIKEIQNQLKQSSYQPAAPAESATQKFEHLVTLV
jgi:preprotein translocase subunit SecG